MNTYDDFRSGFIEKYNKEELKEIETLLDTLFDQDSGVAKGKIWEASASIEKIHQLQETWYISLSKENGDCDEEVNLTYANGIDSGTELVDYDLDGGCGVPICKTIRVIKDVELNKEATERWVNLKGWEFTEITCRKYVALLSNYKDRILKMYKDESYDNYVTGGGTVNTKKHYKSITEELNNKGLFWDTIYEEIEVDIQLR